MTKLILIRHGQSMANATERFAGHSDFDLSDLGRHQAELAADYIVKNFKIDAIYASDLLRAYNTAVPASKLLGLPITPRKGLREIFAGKWESMRFDEIQKTYTEDFDTWKNDFSNARCTEGESVAELYARVCREVLAIAAENDGKCVLIATHATPIRVFETMSRGLSADHVAEVDFVCNASINVFNVDDGVPSVDTLNITDHLLGNVTDVPSIIR